MGNCPLKGSLLSDLEQVIQLEDQLFECQWFVVTLSAAVCEFIQRSITVRTLRWWVRSALLLCHVVLLRYVSVTSDDTREPPARRLEAHRLASECCVLASPPPGIGQFCKADATDKAQGSAEQEQCDLVVRKVSESECPAVRHS